MRRCFHLFVDEGNLPVLADVDRPAFRKAFVVRNETILFGGLARRIAEQREVELQIVRELFVEFRRVELAPK